MNIKIDVNINPCDSLSCTDLSVIDAIVYTFICTHDNCPENIKRLVFFSSFCLIEGDY